MSPFPGAGTWGYVDESDRHECSPQRLYSLTGNYYESKNASPLVMSASPRPHGL